MPYTPPQTPDLWLDASGLSVGSLSTWPDLSGSGNNATQSGALRPTVQANGLNGLNVVNFSSQYMALTTPFYPGTSWTMCVVLKKTSYSSTMVVLGYSGGMPYTLELFHDADTAAITDQANYIIVTDSALSYEIVTIVCNGNSLSYYQNGVLLSVVGSGTISSSALWDSVAAGDGKQNSEGYIAELFIFPLALTTGDRTNVESYLNLKWLASPPLAAGTASVSGAESTSLDVACTAASGGAGGYTYQWYRST